MGLGRRRGYEIIQSYFANVCERVTRNKRAIFEYASSDARKSLLENFYSHDESEIALTYRSKTV